MQAGQRVGVTALSHKAIHKFLEEVEDAAVEAGFAFRGRKKCERRGDAATRAGSSTAPTTNADDARPGAAARRRHVVPLRARGARPARRHAVRRRGRAVRARRRARGRDGGAQPRPARRPEPAGAGLAGLAPAGRGRVGARAPARRGRDGAAGDGHLPRADVADAAGGERATSRRRSTRGGSSRRTVTLDAVGRGRATASASCRSSTTGTGAVVAGGGGRDRAPRSSGSSGRRTRTSTASGRSRHEDFIVVAPYNAQVRCLRERAPGRRSGSARSTSSRARRRRSSSTRWRARAADDVPRGLDFLFSRNRLNVAISRAKCLAYLVASPRLLDANCRTVEQMRL